MYIMFCLFSILLLRLQCPHLSCMGRDFLQLAPAVLLMIVMLSTIVVASCSSRWPVAVIVGLWIFATDRTVAILNEIWINVCRRAVTART